jgi:hypothetical protein
MLSDKAYPRKALLRDCIPVLRGPRVSFLEDQEENAPVLLLEAIKIPQETADKLDLVRFVFDVADVYYEANALLQRRLNVLVCESGLKREILIGPTDDYDVVVLGFERVPLRNRFDDDYLRVVVKDVLNKICCGVAFAVATHC